MTDNNRAAIRRAEVEDAISGTPHSKGHYRVETNVTGPTYHLRGTIWTSEIDRATTFTTKEDAQAALTKSAQFNPKAAKHKTTRIVEN